LPEAIRAAKPLDFSVEYHHDPKNKFRFGQATPDDEWISKVAAAGWIIFSHDRKFHTLLPEAAAIKQYSAGCFYLPGASSPTWDKMHYFMRSYDGIKSRVSQTKKPYIFELHYNGRFAQKVIP
jgi:hypothetical protein